MSDRDELIEKFSKDEVETVEDIMGCMDGPPTADKFRRLLLLFLRGHFMSSDNYDSFEHLACYTWNADERTRTLEVEFTHRDDTLKPDGYPGVFVSFSNVALSRLGLGSNFSGNTQDMSGTHVSKGAEVNFKISFVADKASDAYDLAEMTARVLTVMGKPLALSAQATSFEVEGYAPPKQKKPSPEKYYTVAMGVKITYTHAVTRILESHRIRRIAQVINSQN